MRHNYLAASLVLTLIPTTGLAANSNKDIHKNTIAAQEILSETAKEINQKAVDRLNELVQGEISAIQTYRQALETLGKTPEAETIEEIAADHSDAVKELKALVKDREAVAAKSSGIWGVWAETVVGGAKLIGNESTLLALRQGEEHGVKEYKEAINDVNLSAEAKETISQLLKKQHEHIASLNTLLKTQ